MEFTAQDLATMKQAIEASTIRGADAREIVTLIDKVDGEIIRLTNIKNSIKKPNGQDNS